MEMRLRDRGVIIEDALVIADLHLGREHASNVELALDSASAMQNRLCDLLDRYEPEEVILAGDVLHSFGSLPPGVAEAFENLRACVHDHGAILQITPGNHDVLLDAVWDGPTPSYFELADGETVVIHGDREPEVEASRYVIGHDHPAIEIEGQKRPCYLQGSYRGSEVVVLPAFNELVAGVTINNMRAEDFHSPMIESIGNFRPILRDEKAQETLEFPPLGSFRKML